MLRRQRMKGNAMKNAAVISFACLLAACSDQDPDQETGNASVEVEAERTLVDPLTATTPEAYAGTYALKYEAGYEAEVEFQPDGRVAGTFNGSPISARFSVPEAGRVCFDDVSTGDPPHCWRNEAADENGAWTATMDDGSTLTVTPVG